MSPRRTGEWRVPIEQRFWDKVDEAGEGGCWIWIGAKDRHGYGRIATRHGSAPAKAHRVAWELTNGPVPEGLSVLHRCDTPSCVNPQHLFVGTQADNMRDAATKGRIKLPGLRGESHPNAKLTADQAREIFRRLKVGESQRRLAMEFGVDGNIIRGIQHRRLWAVETDGLS